MAVQASQTDSHSLPPGELAVGDEQPSNDHLALRSVERKVIAHLCSKYTELELVRSDGKPLEGIAAEGVTRIHHYRFTEWPDHGVPAGKSIEALHELVLEVDRRRKELNDCEVWVHWYVLPAPSRWRFLPTGTR